jgi:hypothetical protein
MKKILAAVIIYPNLIIPYFHLSISVIISIVCTGHILAKVSKPDDEVLSVN